MLASSIKSTKWRGCNSENVLSTLRFSTWHCSQQIFQVGTKYFFFRKNDVICTEILLTEAKIFFSSTLVFSTLYIHHLKSRKIFSPYIVYCEWICAMKIVKNLTYCNVNYFQNIVNLFTVIQKLQKSQM
jgi:hypothetical protein